LDSFKDEEFDQYPIPSWVIPPLPYSNNYLYLTLPIDEAIMEVMATPNIPWENLHHCVYFLPSLEWLEEEIKNPVANDNFQWFQSPIMIHDVLLEGNLENIFKTILIDIS
jgi:hypothetical protein